MRQIKWATLHSHVPNMKHLEVLKCNCNSFRIPGFHLNDFSLLHRDIECIFHVIHTGKNGELSTGRVGEWKSWAASYAMLTNVISHLFQRMDYR